LAEAAERFQVEGFHNLPKALRPFLSTGYSVGGSRPKALVAMNKIPMIAKFAMPRVDVWNEPRIEYAALTLATKMGLDVPTVQCIPMPYLSRSHRKTSPNDIFLIKRFDRTENGHRFHMISAKTLLVAHDFESHSYQEIANALAKYAPTQDVDRSRKEIFRRMVFNVLLNNEDDHLKNHAFIWKNGGFSLSPLYDAVPSPSPTTSMQLVLGNNGTDRTLQNCTTKPESFGLNSNEAKHIVQEMADTFYTNWRMVFKDCGVENKDISMLEKVFSKLAPTLTTPNNIGSHSHRI
jgi:serine/threonine-protein kinase HipA